MRWRAYYFPAISASILLLVLIAFSDNLITDVGQESNKQAVFVIHGLFALAWVVVFAAQANLIRTARYGLHRKLGMVAAAIAVGVTLSTTWLFVEVWRPWDQMPFHVKANRFFLVAYVVAVALALHWRKTAHLHKRLILIATLYMLLPVMDRAADHLGIEVYTFNIVTWNALWLSLFAYDRVTTRRVQPVTCAGFAVFYLVWLAAVVL